MKREESSGKKRRHGTIIKPDRGKQKYQTHVKQMEQDIFEMHDPGIERPDRLVSQKTEVYQGSIVATAGALRDENFRKGGDW